MTNRPVPIIYSPTFDRPLLSAAGRLLAGLIAVACLGVLLTGLVLVPSGSGVETHLQLGLNRCAFLERTGLPCPSCGMTTSFALFVRGHWGQSLYTQPMGMVLALATAATVWAGGYIALTGRPAYRALARLNGVAWIVGLMAFGIAAWGWKIFLHTHLERGV